MSGREYLICHGVAGDLGRFRAPDELELERGEVAVVRGRRGLELGEVLRPASSNRGLFPDEFVGDIVRRATADDRNRAAENQKFGQRVFDDATCRAALKAVPAAFLDVEVALDRSAVVLHLLRLGDYDIGALLAELGERHAVIVRHYEVNEVAEPDSHGCGSCGAGGCGSCGDGGCSSCSSGGGQELAAYFAELRSQMMSRDRVALL